MLGYLQLREPHPRAKAAVLNLPLVLCAPWERAPQASEPSARAFLSERPLELGTSGLLCSPGVTAGRHRRPHRAPTWGQAVARVQSPAGGRFPPPGRTQRSLQVLRRGSAGLPGSSPDSTAPLPPRLPLPAPQHRTPLQPSRPAQPQLPASAQTSFQNAVPGHCHHLLPSPPSRHLLLRDISNDLLVTNASWQYQTPAPFWKGALGFPSGAPPVA